MLLWGENMLRRPIESKNTGPYRKILVDVSGEMIVNGTNITKAQLLSMITELENKIINYEPEELAKIFSRLSVSELDYMNLIDFLKLCIQFMDMDLPEVTKDASSQIVIQPIDRTLKYENFSFHLLLNSKKYKIVSSEQVFDGDMIDYLKNGNNYITIKEPYIICMNCEAIESLMVGNKFQVLENDHFKQKEKNRNRQGVISNGWDFSQNQNTGAQSFFNNTLLYKFLHEIKTDEIKKTYWCSYCGSLVFTRVFSKINDSSVNIGLTVFANEEMPDKITLDFPLNFVIYANKDVTDIGDFAIYYDDGYSEFSLLKRTPTSMSIGSDFGSIKFNIITKQIEISFEKKLNKINKNTTFLINLNKDVFLDQLDTIEEYETIKSQFIFNDTFEDFSGSIMRNDSLAPPIKWTPTGVRFSDFKNYTFGKLGIDLMLFHTLIK